METYRIRKRKNRRGKVYFVIQAELLDAWCTILNGKRFDTFGDAVVHLRRKHMNEIVEDKTICEFQL